VKLVPHPATPPTADLAVRAEILVRADGIRLAEYVVTGDVDAVLLPAKTGPARTDGLWQTTCFELFAGEPDSERYYEFNFSPSGRWAAYDFDGYRAAMRDRAVSGEVAIESAKGRSAFAMLVVLDAPIDGRRVGLTAVIEEKDGTKSYWALAHPSPEPDFHHLEGFTLELPPVG
jgi:hypothetical protein